MTVTRNSANVKLNSCLATGPATFRELLQGLETKPLLGLQSLLTQKDNDVQKYIGTGKGSKISTENSKIYIKIV